MRNLPALSRRQLRTHFAERDPVMAALIEAAGPYRLRALECPSPFKHLCTAIIAQQISGSAAASIRRRFVALFSHHRNIKEFPTAEDVLRIDETTLRSAGLSAAKAAAIGDLALKTVEGRIPTSHVLRSLDDETIIERLTAVRGIGRWTVEMFLIFQLGRLDIWPTGDLGVRRGWEKVHRLRSEISPKELEKKGESFRPYRSHLAWYCWRALE